MNIDTLFLKFYLFLAALGLSLVTVCGLLISVTSLVAEGQGTQASIVVASGLSSCSFQALEQRLNSCDTLA